MSNKRISPSEVNAILKESGKNTPPSFRVGAKQTERPIEPVITAAGKIRNCYDATVFDADATPRIFTKRITEDKSFGFSMVSDRLRFRTGCYWSVENGERIKFIKDRVHSISPFKITFEPMNSQRLEVQMTSESSQSNYFSTLFEEAILVEPNSSSPMYYDANDPVHVFKTLLSGGELDDSAVSPTMVENVLYEDHAFSLSSPYSMREIESFTSATHTMYASVKPTYNFYVQDYEGMISSEIPEAVLPNMYVMLTEMSKEKEEKPNDWYLKHITLYNELRLESRSEMMRPPKERTKYDPNSLAVQYFDMYGRQFADAIDDRRLEALGNKFSNLLFSHSSIDNLREYNSRKELFPMFVDIEFSTDKTTEFTQALKDTGMGSAIVNSIFSSKPDYKRFTEQTKTAVQAISETVNANEVITNTSEILDETRRVFDVQQWYTSFESGEKIAPKGFFEQANSIFIGENNPEKEVTDDPKYNLYRSLMSIVFSSKVKDIMRARTRTYKEMMSGKLCHTETVFYRVEKRQGGPEGPVVQNFWLPNSNDISIHKFVDTQVKYGLRYTYTIYAYELVFGSKYTYTDAWVNEAQAGCVVKTEPSLKIVEVPYYSYTNRLMDSPPVMPDVEIIPFKGVSDKIKINLSGNVGRYDLIPSPITPQDASFDDVIRSAQDRFPEDPIRYESDDHAAEFEIFRMEYHPHKYTDFETKLRASVSSDVDINSLNKATSASFVDELLPNKKYWYTFRSVDNHGHISYPSPIYEVEVVDDHGAIYPIIKVVDFAPRTPKEPVKKFKRMMQIVPSYAHGILNEEKSGLSSASSVAERWDRDTLFLGVKDETLWGKKFKIRLTSKKTGRKIDINVVFEHEHLKIKPE